MPPHRNSRYLSTFGVRDDQNRIFLTERTPFRFDNSLDDNHHHVVKDETETLWDLAYHYWGGENGIENAEHFWWAIAEFQPVPILDPTLDLTPGRLLYIPSLRTLQEKILGR